MYFPTRNKMCTQMSHFTMGVVSAQRCQNVTCSLCWELDSLAVCPECGEAALPRLASVPSESLLTLIRKSKGVDPRKRPSTSSQICRSHLLPHGRDSRQFTNPWYNTLLKQTDRLCPEAGGRSLLSTDYRQVTSGPRQGPCLS
jgi:hypothetical protein